MRIVAAPMGARGIGQLRAVDWLPSLDGYEEVWTVCHEALGRLLGA
jgi:hypothetical protein